MKMVPSEKCLDLIKSFEGNEFKAYQDEHGVWTIGVGHTRRVVPGMVWNQAQIDQALLEDLEEATTRVNNLVKVPISQQQFDALVDFDYNEGSGNFSVSTLLKEVNAGRWPDAADQFLVWDKEHIDGVLVASAGLLRRRQAERALFLS